MDEDRIGMSQKERDRLRVMSSVMDGRRTQVEAARLMRLDVRQVRRIQRRLEAGGDVAIVHGLRGRPSNRRIAPERRKKVLDAYREGLMGFGPTFAVEKLRERGIEVKPSTLRNWLVEEGLWTPRRPQERHRRRRERRECFGELVQADASHHDWLEGRGYILALVVMIDDATSRVMARFYAAETSCAYMDLMGRYLRRHGRMGALYTDRHSIFRAEDQAPQDPQSAPTQFARALQELEIGLILAGSPQAKGRVERFNKTAQDRLVKELRLAGAAGIDAANAVLEKSFLPWFNRACAVKPASANDAHRPLLPSMNLAAILSLQEERHVANDYTIRLRNQIYQLSPPALPGLRGAKVVAELRLDGSLHLRFKGRYLDYEPLGLAKAPGAPPPNPRSLPPSQTPAEPAKNEGQAVATAQPSAVRLTSGRSGRAPAEPCPPKGPHTIAVRKPTCPPPDHPWRRTGHFNRPKKADITTCA